MGLRGPKPTKAEAITQAALALFVEQGVRGATTRAIARRAHTTEGNLYRYFPSKQELARRVIGGCMIEFGDHLAQGLAGVTGPAPRLRAFVRAYLEYARSHPMEHAVLVEAHNRELGDLPDEVLRPRRILMEILEEGMKAGVFADGDPRIVAPFIAGGLARSVQLLLAREGDMPTNEAARVLGDSVLRLVGAAPGAG
jgi:AcrR family transcriptional regulator